MTTTGGIQRKKDDLAAGTQIGRYRIEVPVGRGGMGTVYSAFDQTTNRVVALKLLAEGIPPSLRDRFLAECEAEANIRHEHVMPVYDRGWFAEDRPYFVMELLYQPVTLTEIIDEINYGTLGTAYPRIRRWNDLRTLIKDVLLPVCEGVHVANVEYGVQHRDLKPDNVLIDIRTRRAYLIDFGICRSMSPEGGVEKDAGKIVGTPRYLSPEQAAGRVSDVTDVWGMGALLRYAVTGEPPILGTSPFTRQEVNQRIAALEDAEGKAAAQGNEAKARGFAKRREQLEDPTLRVQEDLLSDAVSGVYLPMSESTSAGLAAIIKKAMAVRPEDRYVHAGALAKDLRLWLGGGTVQALSEKGGTATVVDILRRSLNRNVVRVGGALVTLVIGFLVGSGLFSRTPPAPDHRFEDAAEDLEEEFAALSGLIAEADDEALTPLGFSVLLEHIRHEADEVVEPVRAAPEGEERSRLLARYTQLVGLVPPRLLRVGGWEGRSWDVSNLVNQSLASDGSVVSLAPGMYHVTSRPNGVSLRIAVPGAPRYGFASKGGTLERMMRFSSGGGEIPADSTWVPAGPVGAGTTQDEAAFIAKRDFVTNEKYSEWLDDLPNDDRHARVPRTGFRRSDTDVNRWLVEAGAASKPVLGIAPADARAYANWRSQAEGIPYRLPSAAMWHRMAAIETMGEPGAELLYPWMSPTSWRIKHRAGDRKARGSAFWRSRDGEEFDESPYGVRHLFGGPGEMVLGDDGATFVVKGRGGILPMASAVERSEPIAPDATDHEYGFRLVYRP